MDGEFMCEEYTSRDLGYRWGNFLILSKSRNPV